MVPWDSLGLDWPVGGKHNLGGLFRKVWGPSATDPSWSQDQKDTDSLTLLCLCSLRSSDCLEQSHGPSGVQIIVFPDDTQHARRSRLHRRLLPMAFGSVKTQNTVSSTRGLSKYLKGHYPPPLHYTHKEKLSSSVCSCAAIFL